MGVIEKAGIYASRTLNALHAGPTAAAAFGPVQGAVQFRRTLRGGVFSPEVLAKTLDFVLRTLSPLTEKYNTPGYSSFLAQKIGVTRTPFWFCWPQGEGYMPPTALLCYRRLRQMTASVGEVHLITLKNMRSYTDLPKVIEKRYFERSLSFNVLRDYLRTAFLCAYGGVWVDPDVYFARAPFRGMFGRSFFSPKMSEGACCRSDRGLWDRRLISVLPNEKAMNYVREAYILWWTRFDRAPDEALFDHFLFSAYRSVPEIRAVLDEVGENHGDFDSLSPLLALAYDKEKFSALSSVCGAFSLGAATDPPLFTARGEQTLFGALCSDTRVTF